MRRVSHDVDSNPLAQEIKLDSSHYSFLEKQWVSKFLGHSNATVKWEKSIFFPFLLFTCYPNRAYMKKDLSVLYAHNYISVSSVFVFVYLLQPLIYENSHLLMERDPSLASPSRPYLEKLLEGEEISFSTPQPINNNNNFVGEHEEPQFVGFVSRSSQHLEDPTAEFRPPNARRKTGLHRSKTAPAMAVMRDLKQHASQTQKPHTESGSIIRQAIFLLFLYLLLGVTIYSFNRDHFSGVETHPVVDALYFCIVTMCTIGYGDITPLTPGTKVFACVFVLVGFGFIDVLLSGVVNYVLDLQENMILTSIRVRGSHSHGGFSARNYIYDVEKGRMRIRIKVGLALGVVVLCIGTGTMVLYFVEHLDWIDSVYLSVMSVTTVGYGDRAFKTLPGRLFAAVWLLLSTLAVARAFLYLAEARIDKRHRRIAKWVLHRHITVEDLLAAGINNNGFISKSEYVIFKLKEMGKISQKDILQICKQFSKLDPNNSGKLTLPDLLEGRS